MQFPSDDAELTLIFDHFEFQTSAEQIEVLRGKLAEVEGVLSVQLQTEWMRTQHLTVSYRRDISPHTMLRKMAEVLRGTESSLHAPRQESRARSGG